MRVIVQNGMGAMIYYYYRLHTLSGCVRFCSRPLLENVTCHELLFVRKMDQTRLIN